MPGYRLVVLKLDHMFVLTKPGAAAGDRLVEAGLVEGRSNRHSGQGTANRRFFFDNGMLELLYIHDADEARAGPGRGLRLVERATHPEASPCGLITADDSPGDTSEPPFPGWAYHPDYLDRGRHLHVGAASDRLSEPLCVHAPFKMPRLSDHEPQDPRFSRLTRVELSVPVAELSPELRCVAADPLVDVRLNEPHDLTLTFNHGRSGQRLDMSPDLPLQLIW